MPTSGKVNVVAGRWARKIKSDKKLQDYKKLSTYAQKAKFREQWARERRVRLYAGSVGLFV